MLVNPADLSGNFGAIDLGNLGPGAASLSLSGGPLTVFLQYVLVDSSQPRGFSFSNALQIEL